MLQSITGFMDELIRSLISVPTQFIRAAASNNWDYAFESLFSQGGLALAVILLLIIWLTRRQTRI
jgi:hypothetical protein